MRLALNDGGNDEDAVTQATHMTLRMLAERIEQLTAQINELNQRLARLVEHHAPQLLEPVGFGPDSAVPLLITMGDNSERLNTEASFAVLCAVSPIEYSSGSAAHASARLRRRPPSKRGLAPHRLHPAATVTDGTYARINRHGEIDADTLPSLQAALTALAPDVGDVLFDLRDTPFMSAAGLRVLFDHSVDASPPRRRTVTGLRSQPLRLLLIAADLNPAAYDLARILPDTLPADF
nr:STAS domain-containing protein [Streptomyces sp. alain-838]